MPILILPYRSLTNCIRKDRPAARRIPYSYQKVPDKLLFVNLGVLNTILTLSPFHNYCTSTLQHFEIGFFGFARANAYVERALAFAIGVFCGRIKSLKKLDMRSIQTRPNAIQIIAIYLTNISKNVLHRFVYSQFAI